MNPAKSPKPPSDNQYSADASQAHSLVRELLRLLGVNTLRGRFLYMAGLLLMMLVIMAWTVNNRVIEVSGLDVELSASPDAGTVRFPVPFPSE